MRTTIRTKIETPKTTFNSCAKDTALIVKKLFEEPQSSYINALKRLLIINTKDCLDSDNPAYIEKIDNTSTADLIDEGYIRTTPKIYSDENQEAMSYIRISYDNFVPSENDHYRDCILIIDIICHINNWDLGGFRARPIEIMGYIDGVLNKSKLTGIGTLNFIGANELIVNDSLSGYCLMYSAYHGDDDSIEELEEDFE